MFLSRFRRRLQSLRVAIALAVVAGVLLASFLSYLEQTKDLRERHTASIQEQLGRVAALTALALREPLWQFDLEQANSIMEAAFVDPDVVSIRVWDQSGLPFVSRQRQAENTQMVEANSRVVRRSAVTVGKLTIEMSSAGYLRLEQAARTQYLRQAAQTSMVALLVILLLMHWRMVRPVEKLVQASRRIEQGQLDTPILRVFEDEIGALADSLEATRRALLNLVVQLENRNQALTQANEHLEQRVTERTASLEQALVDLARAQREMVETEKLASLGRVVAGVAHELNTPIGNALTVVSTIQSDLEALQSGFANGTMKRSQLGNFLGRVDEGLGLSLGNLKRAAQLIADFKQVSVDQISDQRRSFDLAEVTGEVLNMLQPTLRNTGGQVRRTLQPGLHCDSFPGQFGQVVSNLVLNAARHAFAPGESATIEVVVAAVDGDRVELRVIDHGLGMEASVRERIFDPFFTTKMGRGGTGLGMNIVHGIVTRVLGGQILVASELGAGTTITVVFPKVAAQRVTTPDMPRPQLPRSPRGNPSPVE